MEEREKLCDQISELLPMVQDDALQKAFEILQKNAEDLKKSKKMIFDTIYTTLKKALKGKFEGPFISIPEISFNQVEKKGEMVLEVAARYDEYHSIECDIKGYQIIDTRTDKPANKIGIREKGVTHFCVFRNTLGESLEIPVCEIMELFKDAPIYIW